ncbi:hypothetical protein [Phenylobacterium sp.]
MRRLRSYLSVMLHWWKLAPALLALAVAVAIALAAGSPQLST